MVHLSVVYPVAVVYESVVWITVHFFYGWKREKEREKKKIETHNQNDKTKINLQNKKKALVNSNLMPV